MNLEDERLNALIGAAYEAAAKDVDEWAEEEGEATLSAVAASIRALTPADALSALDRIRKEARAMNFKDEPIWVKIGLGCAIALIVFQIVLIAAELIP